MIPTATDEHPFFMEQPSFSIVVTLCSSRSTPAHRIRLSATHRELRTANDS
jgi:hypothetical protein